MLTMKIAWDLDEVLLAEVEETDLFLFIRMIYFFIDMYEFALYCLGMFWPLNVPQGLSNFGRLAGSFGISTLRS